MIVRRAQSDDYEAVMALLREADVLHAQILPGYFKPPRRAARTREELGRLLGAKDEALYVADDPAAGVLALCHVQIYDTPAMATMVAKRRAHIDNLIVTEAARRRGIGRQLVDAGAGWAREQGARELLLTVWAGNTAADRFYEALGFGRVSSVLGRTLE